MNYKLYLLLVFAGLSALTLAEEGSCINPDDPESCSADEDSEPPPISNITTEGVNENDGTEENDVEDEDEDQYAREHDPDTPFDYFNFEKFASCDLYIHLDSHAVTYEYDSAYQKVSYMENVDARDVCLDLDDIVQICSQYRPHYHEHFVHFPAAYFFNNIAGSTKNEVKRVAFIGGGDSMLLHEVLKYPSVELILGLELDQTVVRQSFTRFWTSPHWDNDKVEWWYGDASKSLKLLPREYFGTFDMVLVDLSETVMSFPVSKKLDILGALALLLKPEGIFVKNQYYFEKMSEIFNHSAQLYLPENPMICDQDWSMGSNAIDFLSPDFKFLDDQKIETLLYEPITENNHYNVLVEYSNNIKAKAMTLPDDLSGDVEDQSVGKAPGILQIIEAENMTNFDFNSDSISGALKELSPIKTLVSKETEDGIQNGIILLKEGFLSFHHFAEFKYCAVDLHLFAGFSKLESTKDSLKTSLGGIINSTYKFIVGGMSGTPTNMDDMESVGPDLRILRQSKPENINFVNEDVSEEPHFGFYSTMTDYIVKSNNIFKANAPVNAVVVCGDKTDPCETLSVLKEEATGDKHRILAIWQCSEDGEDFMETSDETRITNAMLCGQNAGDVVDSFVEEYNIIDLVALDPRVSAEQLGINGVEKLCLKYSIRDYFEKHSYILDLAYDEDDVWRKEFQQTCFKFLPNDDKWIADFTVDYNTTGSNIKKQRVALTVSGKPDFFEDTVSFSKSAGTEVEASLTINHMKKGPPHFQQEFSPHNYELEDYDNRPGIEQYANQKPVAMQSIYQYHILGTEILTFEKFSSVFKSALKESNYRVEEIYATNNESIGEGFVFTALLYNGHFVAVFDGKRHFDLNILTIGTEYEQDLIPSMHTKFGKMQVEEVFAEFFPRGHGRVVNFPQDMNKASSWECWDKWDLCGEFKEAGECESDPSWMDTNCRKTCGFC